MPLPPVTLKKKRVSESSRMRENRTKKRKKIKLTHNGKKKREKGGKSFLFLLARTT